MRYTVFRVVGTAKKRVRGRAGPREVGTSELPFVVYGGKELFVLVTARLRWRLHVFEPTIIYVPCISTYGIFKLELRV